MNQERVSNSCILRLRFPAAYALAVTLAAAPVCAIADTLFKCRWADGQVHYQATRCEAGQLEEQLVTKPPTAEPPAANDPAAYVIVYRDPNNQYLLMGTIDGYPTPMLIDTGAFLVSIPPSLAQKIGAKCESSGIVNTAGGTSAMCRSRVHSIKLGSITLTDVEIMIMPDLKTEVLLGQSALKRLKVEQAKGEIRLSVIEGVTK